MVGGATRISNGWGYIMAGICSGRGYIMAGIGGGCGYTMAVQG